MAKKNIPVPHEFMERFDEILRIEKSIYDLKRELDIKSSSLWLDFEKKFDLRGQVLKYNKDTKEVEVMERDNKAEEKVILDKIRAGQMSPVAGHQGSVSTEQMGNALPRLHMKKTSLWGRIRNSFRKNNEPKPVKHSLREG